VSRVPSTPAEPGFEIVCIAHLWWDWVWQRPQHLMTAFARRGVPITYVEEPRIEIGEPDDRFEVLSAEDGVRVARLGRTLERDGFWRMLDAASATLGGQPLAVDPSARLASVPFGSELQPELEHRVLELFPPVDRARPLVVWLYTPLAMRLAELLEPTVLVHDVMDDLAAFRFAPPGIAEQRDALLAAADLVFAGGPTLHEAVREQRPDAGLFPSGVDAAHFSAAQSRDLPLPASIAHLHGPMAIYVGVIDERIDLPLLAEAARAAPGWHWVMVGPTLKIEEREIPRAPNVHFVGKAPYADLPGYLARADVAIMPFALNEATRSISPTKTLEYLAAGVPVVTTPVRDVVALYGSAVTVAADGGAFAAAVMAAATDGSGPRTPSPEARRLIEAASWDRIASAMLEAVEAAVAAKARPGS
jgi:UDP-galactopyranose mutase